MFTIIILQVYMIRLGLLKYTRFGKWVLIILVLLPITYVVID